MKRADIERIIKTGSVKQKIKLYMTDTAMVSVDPSILEFIELEGKLLAKGTPLLTAKEKDTLWESIKERKDIEYYEEMRRANKAFLLFMDKLKLSAAGIVATYLIIDTVFTKYAKSLDLSETLNDLLEVYPDEESRKKAYELAALQLESQGLKQYEAEGNSWFEADGDRYYKRLAKNVGHVNSFNQSIKEYHTLLTAITRKELPLKPYIDWLIDIEKNIIGVNNEIQKRVAFYEKSVKPVKPTLISYEAIEVAEITDEDITDFKETVR